MFTFPCGVAVALNGNVVVADTSNNRIRYITPTGTVTTIAGRNTGGGYADGVGTNAVFNGPYGIAFGNGKIYVSSEDRIRSITIS